ncbi:MAG: autotransporter outer membrane beta-barrel domain-containing protein [Planctomycetaceae bacterium]|nr:autotransporter outer membrane beta-barrel domain-containing protein [Planctomycetaceae bacterium]
MSGKWFLVVATVALFTGTVVAQDVVYEYDALDIDAAYDIDEAQTVPGKSTVYRDGAALPSGAPPVSLAETLASASDEAAIVHLFSSGNGGVFHAGRDVVVAKDNTLRVGVSAGGGSVGGTAFLILSDDPDGQLYPHLPEQDLPTFDLDVAGSVEVVGSDADAVVSARGLTVREGGSFAVSTESINPGRVYVETIQSAGSFHVGFDSEVRVRAATGPEGGYGLTVRGGHMRIDGLVDLSAADDIVDVPRSDAYHRGVHLTGGTLELGEFGILDFRYLPGYRVDVNGGHLHIKPFMVDYPEVDFSLAAGEIELGAAATDHTPPLDSRLTVGHADIDGGVLRLHGMSEFITVSGSSGTSGSTGDWRIGSGARVKAVTDDASCARLVGVAGKRLQVDGVIDISEGNLALVTGGGVAVVNGEIFADNTYSLRLEGGELAMGEKASVSLGTSRLAAIAAATADGVVNSAALSGEETIVTGIGKTGQFADGADYEYTFRTALGRFTMVADTSGADGSLVIARGEGVVSYAGTSAADVAADKRNFAANVGDIYKAPVAASGLADTAFHAVAGTVSAGSAYQPLTPVAASAPGHFNSAFLNAFASGDGNPFSVAMPGADDAALQHESRVTDGLLDAYVGNNQGGYAMASVATTSDNRRGVMTRMEQINRQWASARSVAGDGALAAAAMNADMVNRVWAGALGQWEGTAARDGLDGYTFDSYGLMVGVDAAFAGCFVGGVSFGYATGDYKNKAMASNDSTIDSYSVSGYLGYNHPSGVFGTLMAGYVHSDNSIRERDAGGSYREDFDAGSWHAGATVGYELRPISFVHISPSIGLSYIATRSDAHNRTLDGIGDILRYGRMRYDSFILPVDVTVGLDVKAGNGQILHLSANGGYSYNFDADGADGSVLLNGLSGSSVSYAAVTRQNGHHTWNLGLGAKFTSALWEVGGKYDYYGRSSSDTHRVVAYVARRF